MNKSSTNCNDNGGGHGHIDCKKKHSIVKRFPIQKYNYFFNELKIYKKNLKYIPKLLHYNIFTRTLYIQKIDVNPNVNKKQLIPKLEEQFYNDTGYYHNDVHEDNILVDKNNNIYLIDFEYVARTKICKCACCRDNYHHMLMKKNIIYFIFIIVIIILLMII